MAEIEKDWEIFANKKEGEIVNYIRDFVNQPDPVD